MIKSLAGVKKEREEGILSRKGEEYWWKNCPEGSNLLRGPPDKRDALKYFNNFRFPSPAVCPIEIFKGVPLLRKG
jgi:hypothetical protein